MLLLSCTTTQASSCYKPELVYTMDICTYTYAICAKTKCTAQQPYKTLICPLEYEQENPPRGGWWVISGTRWRSILSLFWKDQRVRVECVRGRELKGVRGIIQPKDGVLPETQGGMRGQQCSSTASISHPCDPLHNLWQSLHGKILVFHVWKPKHYFALPT